MAIHMRDILDYLNEHPILCYNGSVNSLMEMLYEAYISCNHGNSEEINALFQAIDDLISSIPKGQREKLTDSVCTLCSKCEVTAFSQGLVVGMHMMAEIHCLQ